MRFNVNKQTTLAKTVGVSIILMMLVCIICSIMYINTYATATSGEVGGTEWWLEGTVLYIKPLAGANGDMGTDIVYPTDSNRWGNSIIDVVVMDGVTGLSPYAFYGCTRLDSVTLPEGLTQIPDYCFCDCTGLQKINFPSTLSRIGSGAFYNCKMLHNIKCPTGLQQNPTVGGSAFYYCTKLAEESTFKLSYPHAWYTGYTGGDVCVLFSNLNGFTSNSFKTELPESTSVGVTGFDKAKVIIPYAGPLNGNYLGELYSGGTLTLKRRMS